MFDTGKYAAGAAARTPPTMRIVSQAEELEDKVAAEQREAMHIDKEYVAKLLQDDLELFAICAAFFGSVIDEHAVKENRAKVARLDAEKNEEEYVELDELLEDSEDEEEEEDKKPFGWATANDEAGPSGGVIDIPSGSSDSSSDADNSSELQEYLNRLDGK